MAKKNLQNNPKVLGLDVSTKTIGWCLFDSFNQELLELTHISPRPKNNSENNDLPEFSKCLNDVYKGNNDFHEAFCEINVWKKIMKIVGDIIFSCPTIQLFGNLNSIKVKNNFFYKFSYKSTSNVWPSWIGTSHGM